MNHRHLRSAAIVAALLGLAACAPAGENATLHLNQIQVIGTHNSYHSGMSPVAMAWLRHVAPRHADELDYSHKPLPVQLDHGVRQLEIDIYADSSGDRYIHPKGPGWERAAGFSPDPADTPSSPVRTNDFKVMHILDIDQHSSCEPLRACLLRLRAWSDANPTHLPVFILLETKEGHGDSAVPGVSFTQPENFTPALYDQLDAEIRDVLTPARLITPDDIRGSSPTLDAAVRAGHWPTLAASRGKFMFLFDQVHDTAPYELGHPALRGRVVFANSEPGRADAAFVKRNNGTAAEIGALVRAGYLVRTRADEGTWQARTNDTRKRDTALRSGAQIVSTDYPASEPARRTGYRVDLGPGVVARCNPVNAPPNCSAAPPLRP